MKDKSIAVFKKRIAVACLVIAAIHISACLYLNFFPSGPLSDLRLASLYKSRILIGPFFIADRLKISPHLMISYKPEQGSWTPYTDEAIENVRTFQRKPWQYSVRSQGIFLRGAAKRFNIRQKKDSLNVLTSPEFVTLNSYLVREVLPDHVDSIKLVYIVNTFNAPSLTVKTDTAWTLSYKLHDQLAR